MAEMATVRPAPCSRALTTPSDVADWVPLVMQVNDQFFVRYDSDEVEAHPAPKDKAASAHALQAKELTVRPFLSLQPPRAAQLTEVSLVAQIEKQAVPLGEMGNEVLAALLQRTAAHAKDQPVRLPSLDPHAPVERRADPVALDRRARPQAEKAPVRPSLSLDRLAHARSAPNRTDPSSLAQPQYNTAGFNALNRLDFLAHQSLVSPPPSSSSSSSSSSAEPQPSPPLQPADPRRRAHSTSRRPPRPPPPPPRSSARPTAARAAPSTRPPSPSRTRRSATGARARRCTACSGPSGPRTRRARPARAARTVRRRRRRRWRRRRGVPART